MKVTAVDPGKIEVVKADGLDTGLYVPYWYECLNTTLLECCSTVLPCTVKVHIQIVKTADIVCRFLCDLFGKNMSVCVYYIFTVT